MELNIEQYEYVGVLTDEAGVRVFIGTQNSMPFPYELGISVPPGFSTGIMLQKVLSTSNQEIIMEESRSHRKHHSSENTLKSLLGFLTFCG